MSERKVCDERKLSRARAEKATDEKAERRSQSEIFILFIIMHPAALLRRLHSGKLSKELNFSVHYLIHGIMNVETKALNETRS